MSDPIAWAKSVADLVKGHIARALLPLEARLAAIEARQPERGEKGDTGKDGESVSIDDVRPVIDEFLKSIQPPKDGIDGKDGKGCGRCI